jgi:hypothetical protein
MRIFAIRMLCLVFTTGMLGACDETQPIDAENNGAQATDRAAKAAHLKSTEAEQLALTPESEDAVMGCPHAADCPCRKAGKCPYATGDKKADGGCPHMKGGGCPHMIEGGHLQPRTGGCPHLKALQENDN